MNKLLTELNKRYKIKIEELFKKIASYTQDDEINHDIENVKHEAFRLQSKMDMFAILESALKNMYIKNDEIIQNRLIEKYPEKIAMDFYNRGFDASHLNKLLTKQEVQIGENNTKTFLASKSSFSSAVKKDKLMEDFNSLNRDFNLVLRATYDAKRLEQKHYIVASRKNPNDYNNIERIMLVSDEMNLTKNDNKLSYTEFDAKYSILRTVYESIKINEIGATNLNKLSLYNNICKFLNQIKKTEAEQNLLKYFDENCEILRAVNDIHLNNVIKEATSQDVKNFQSSISAKIEILDRARKSLEVDLFGKSLKNFDMKKITTNFTKAVKLNIEDTLNHTM